MLSDVRLHSSIVRAPEISVAPSNGAKNKISFQNAGLWALITFNWALRYNARKSRPAHAAVECPEGIDSNESSIWFLSPVQMLRSYIRLAKPVPDGIDPGVTLG